MTIYHHSYESWTELYSVSINPTLRPSSLPALAIPSHMMLLVCPEDEEYTKTIFLHFCCRHAQTRDNSVLECNLFFFTQITENPRILLRKPIITIPFLCHSSLPCWAHIGRRRKFQRKCMVLAQGIGDEMKLPKRKGKKNRSEVFNQGTDGRVFPGEIYTQLMPVGSSRHQLFIPRPHPR